MATYPLAVAKRLHDDHSVLAPTVPPARPSTPNLVGSEPKVSSEPIEVHCKAAKPPATTVKELQQMADNLSRSMNKAADNDDARFAVGTNGNQRTGQPAPLSLVLPRGWVHAV